MTQQTKKLCGLGIKLSHLLQIVILFEWYTYTYWLQQIQNFRDVLISIP